MGDELLQYISTGRGGVCLYVNHFKYVAIKHDPKSGRTYWRCENGKQKGCSSRCCGPKEATVVSELSFSGEHNHPPPPSSKRFVERTIENLKKKSKKANDVPFLCTEHLEMVLKDEMTTVYQFKNCLLLRNHQIVKEDLWIRNRKIINPEPLFFEEKVTADCQIDCNGCIIAPGFIDVQINGGFGIDFTHMTCDVAEGVATVAKGILSHGVTSFCPTIVTSPAEKYHKLLPCINVKDGGADGAGVLGVHLEGPFISKEKKGAHSVQYIRQLDRGFEDVTEAYGCLENVSVVTMAPELDPEGTVIRELSNRKIMVSLGHSSGNLSDGEKAMKAGACFITHLFNAMLPFHHRDPGLVGLLTSEKLPQDKTVYYGIIADGIHTHPAALRIAHRANSCGLVLVTDAISPMGLQEGTHYIGDQKIEIKGQRALIVGTDTLCGSVATMDICVKFFQKATGCTNVEALECASLHPAEALGITKRKGTLGFSTDADFVMLTDDLTVKATYIAGEQVWRAEDFETKISFNT